MERNFRIVETENYQALICKDIDTDSQAPVIQISFYSQGKRIVATYFVLSMELRERHFNSTVAEVEFCISQILKGSQKIN